MKAVFSLSTRRWADGLCRRAERIANHRSAMGFVFLLELIGCTVVPLPNALVMVALVTSAPRRWVRFGFSATLGSVAGGVALYVIGRLFFQSYGQSLVTYYGAAEGWAGAVEWFNSGWGISFVIFACMSTGLFRVASIGAGFTAMNPLLFLAVLSLSRCTRWVAECGAIKYVGERARTWPRHYFKYAAVGVALLVFTVLIVMTLTA
jgi:membrane protein YqaA with SNARE-associated domain